METRDTYKELAEKFDADKAIVLMNAIRQSIEEQNMASKQDLELQRSEIASMLKDIQNEQLRAMNRTTLWLVASIMSAAGLIIAAIKFL